MPGGECVTPIRPKFTNPPLIERAISVVFSPLPRFAIGEYGLFWSEVIDQFPQSEAMEPVAVTLEEFDGFRPLQPSVQIIPGNASPRAAFRNVGTGELLQLQENRFGFNWLKVSQNHAYPHSEATFERFYKFYDLFQKFVDRRNLGEINVVQCEITNVNVVPVSDVGRNFSDMATVFKLAPVSAETAQLQLEHQLVGSKHLILNDHGHPIGRVHALGQPSIRVPDNEEAYRLDITARGAPLGDGLQGVRAFFEEAVSAVNGVFLATVTKAGRQFWGEYDG